VGGAAAAQRASLSPPLTSQACQRGAPKLMSKRTTMQLERVADSLLLSHSFASTGCHFASTSADVHVPQMRLQQSAQTIASRSWPMERPLLLLLLLFVQLLRSSGACRRLSGATREPKICQFAPLSLRTLQPKLNCCNLKEPLPIFRGGAFHLARNLAASLWRRNLPQAPTMITRRRMFWNNWACCCCRSG